LERDVVVEYSRDEQELIWKAFEQIWTAIEVIKDILEEVTDEELEELQSKIDYRIKYGP